MDEIVYINRKTGDRVVEKVPGGGMMKFLYSSNVLGRFTLWLLIKRRFFSTMAGWFMNSRFSKKSIGKFIKTHQINMAEYIVPPNGFKHFNAFFYRKIKLDKRPIGNGIVSPADGKLLVFPSIKNTETFFVKGRPFNLSAFLQNEKDALKFEGGSMAIIRLAPTDYHRYHFPVTGFVGDNNRIFGDYYSVSPLALRQRMEIFSQNAREYVIVKSKQYGEVLICDVGATLTGSIVQSHWPNIEIQKGQEKGYFAFGGSTIILLFEKGKMTFSEDLIKNTQLGLETAIKMGETIGN
ncbi:phosphatidylserine decarboxylase [Putridiphycobacter roseus]|uniref:phosphatidylserine decarboxylase n=1 Tax=Putridiphycobacter roseus TaxID=2219161 RepID=A0A2W1NI39_9FLAO|nr:archaetidylserine decarboxylase [Putridiphycobacter roseus]PZE18693.1 phosphatidylserine decarboxylase [Putridiphycobacter roseus]